MWSWFRALVVCALSMVACAGDPGPPVRVPAEVERIVDGDTLIARIGTARVRVRLIGIDTPEIVKPGAPVDCFGPESSAEAKRLLEGEDVMLEYDRQRHDRFRRVLAYVYRTRDGTFVNEAMLERGFARLLVIEPNDSRARELEDAEGRARRARLGLWKACAA